ncbi:MAG TPA: polysaccharide deacetylase family protein, partial [Thermomicrobiales bacterium]|nr:polysaccharide deacetylase family protein [Thermomicrobiales bacterium]
MRQQRRSTRRTSATSPRSRIGYTIRPAALLVVILSGIVGLFGIHHVQSVDPAVDLSPTLAPPTVQVLPTRDATFVPPPTGIPPSEVPTIVPSLVPTATLVPTIAPTAGPTEIPTPGPRPAAPATGMTSKSYILYRGESGRKEVALTFDAGQTTGYTSQMLDILDQYGIKGSFGVTGEWAQANPDLLKRMVDEGHMLINHTYDHASWSGLSLGTEPLTADQMTQELTKTEQIIKDQTGYELKPYFRFPYGDYNDLSLQVLFQNGYDWTLWWTCDTEAWNGNVASQIEEKCSPDDPTHGGPGAIILMHVIQEEDLKALPALIDAYKAEG